MISSTTGLYVVVRRLYGPAQTDRISSEMGSHAQPDDRRTVREEPAIWIIIAISIIIAQETVIKIQMHTFIWGFSLSLLGGEGFATLRSEP